ncbi:GAF domain-containing protein [Aquisalimonas sp.]|uniref:GAF domain-containing protein n=1 Tax=Aquisalimonas sp. TaxID=1872621 RepID=UPI0025BEF812|nr:GAF domain-containing protein [Aquisalimonas sp.]
MAFTDLYYDGFGERWLHALETVAAESGIDSLLIMRSTPTHMIAVVSAGPRRDTYTPGDAGPKSVNPGYHKLYCEQVVNDAAPLHVPDAAADPEWEGNEDLVQFGLGTYLGYPIKGPGGDVLGTICVLHSEPIDFDAGLLSLRQRLDQLRIEIENDLERVAA